MKQAISTKSFGCTNTRPRRIRVKAYAGTRFYSEPSLENECDKRNLLISRETLHLLAARRFVADFGWVGNMIGGETTEGFAFVFDK